MLTLTIKNVILVVVAVLTLMSGTLVSTGVRPAEARNYCDMPGFGGNFKKVVKSYVPNPAYWNAPEIKIRHNVGLHWWDNGVWAERNLWHNQTSKKWTCDVDQVKFARWGRFMTKKITPGTRGYRTEKWVRPGTWTKLPWQTKAFYHCKLWQRQIVCVDDGGRGPWNNPNIL